VDNQGVKARWKRAAVATTACRRMVYKKIPWGATFNQYGTGSGLDQVERGKTGLWSRTKGLGGGQRQNWAIGSCSAGTPPKSLEGSTVDLANESPI